MHIAMVCQYHEYKNAISDLTSSPWGERRENMAPSPLSERDTSQFFLRPENKIIFWNFPTCRNCSCRRGRGGGTWCQSRWGRAGGSLHLSPPCHQSPWETSVMCRVLKTGERVFWNWIWKYFGCPDITCWSFSLWFPRRRDSPCLRNQTPLETLEWGEYNMEGTGACSGWFWTPCQSPWPHLWPPPPPPQGRWQSALWLQGREGEPALN